MKIPNTTNWDHEQWMDAAMQMPRHLLLSLRAKSTAKKRRANNVVSAHNGKPKHCGLCGRCDSCARKGLIKTPAQQEADAALSAMLVQDWKTHRNPEQILALYDLHGNGAYVANLLGVTRAAVSLHLVKHRNRAAAAA